MPSWMLSWWKAAVLEKTSTSNSWSPSWAGWGTASLSGTMFGPSSDARARATALAAAFCSAVLGSAAAGAACAATGAAAAGDARATPAVALSGRATIVIKDVPSARRADLLDRVMNEVITNSFIW